MTGFFDRNAIIQMQQNNALLRQRRLDEENRQLANALMARAAQTGDPNVLMQATMGNPYATPHQQMAAINAAQQQRETAALQAKKQRQQALFAKEMAKLEHEDDPYSAAINMLALNPDVPHNVREALYGEQTRRIIDAGEAREKERELQQAFAAYREAVASGDTQRQAILVTNFPAIRHYVSATAEGGAGGDPLDTDPVRRRSIAGQLDSAQKLDRGLSSQVFGKLADDEFLEDHFSLWERLNRERINAARIAGFDVSDKSLADIASHAEFGTYLDQAFNEYRFLITGAAAATSELNLLKASFPSDSWKTSDAVFKARLRVVQNKMQAEIDHYNGLLDQGLSRDQARAEMHKRLHGTGREALKDGASPDGVMERIRAEAEANGWNVTSITPNGDGSYLVDVVKDGQEYSTRWN